MPVNTLFFQNLRENEKIRKSVLHALIERIQAYPDRKVEVKFRIGEKTEGTGGGQKLDPHESTYPVPSFTTGPSADYICSYLVLSAEESLINKINSILFMKLV